MFTVLLYDCRDGYTQPDGVFLEDCSVIKMHSLHSTQNWEDIPCSQRAARQFICKKAARKSGILAQPERRRKCCAFILTSDVP